MVVLSARARLAFRPGAVKQGGAKPPFGRRLRITVATAYAELDDRDWLGAPVSVIALGDCRVET